jgi:K+-sensing histidine kinase KdpD
VRTKRYHIKAQYFIYNGEGCLLVLMRDVTEMQLLQEARHKVNLMKMLHTTVSHDMMNPLSNIKFFSDRMLEQGQQRNMQDMVKFHKLINDSATIVSSRMSDLLDQNLIEHGSFAPREVGFSPLKAVSQITSILENYLKNFDVQIQQDYDHGLS